MQSFTAWFPLKSCLKSSGWKSLIWFPNILKWAPSPAQAVHCKVPCFQCCLFQLAACRTDETNSVVSFSLLCCNWQPFPNLRAHSKSVCDFHLNFLEFKGQIKVQSSSATNSSCPLDHDPHSFFYPFMTETSLISNQSILKNIDHFQNFCFHGINIA